MRKLKLLIAACALLLGAGGLYAQTSWTGDVTNGDGMVFTAQYGDPSNHDVQEMWSNNATNPAFDLNQSFVDMPEGVYELSAQAMYRASLTYGTPTNCVLYATVGENTYSTPLANFGDYSSNEDRGIIEKQMKNNNAYTNKLPCIIVKNGSATVGIKSIGDLTYCTNGYWFVWKKSTFSFKNVTSDYHAKLVARANAMLADAPESSAKTTLTNAVSSYSEATVANIEALQSAISAFLLTATSEAPLNVTSYIVNPSFEDNSGNKKNWIQDMGYKQPSDMYQPTGWNMLYSSKKVDNTQWQTFKTQENGAKDGYCLYVRHRWGDVYAVESLHQLVKELPSGAYKLTVAVKGGSSVTDPNTLSMSTDGITNTTTVSDFDKQNYKDYSVSINKETAESDIDISYGWNQKTGNEQLYYVDDFRLYFLGDPLAAKKKEVEDLQASLSSILSDEAYINVVGNERTVLSAKQTATASATTIEAYQALMDEINDAINAFTAAKTNYDALVAEVAYAKTLGITTADDYAATSTSTAATALANTQNLKVAEYQFINENYPNNVSSLLGTWTRGNYDTTSGQGYISDETYFDKWSGSAVDLTSSATVTLPAGKYTVRVAGRGVSSTTMNLSVKVGEADAVSTPFLLSGDTGRGIDTNGATNFSDEGAYSNNNNGRGWQYRYITFTTDGTSEITISINGHLNGNTWQSFYAPVLLTDDASIKNARLAEISAALATIPTEGKMNADVKSTLDAKKAAAEAATTANTKEELATILEELNAAISAANASIAAYTSANDKLAEMEKLTEQTNVYTAEALEAYYTTPKAKYDNNTLTDEEANALENPFSTTGHRAATLVDNFLLSAWNTNPDFTDAPYYINTWSTEGNTDGSGMTTPFFEYFVDNGAEAKLGARTLTATVNGVASGNYTVDVLVRVTKNSGEAETPTGITLDVNGGEATDICAGKKDANGRFYGTFRALGYVGSDGVLKVNINVAEDNNVHWLSFKNVVYKEFEGATDAQKQALADAIAEGESKVLGFEAGQYAPYNNIAAQEALAAAKAIDPATANVSEITTATNNLKDVWMANTEDVDAIFNGDMAIANGNNPKGWTRSNNAWGQQVDKEGASSGKAWYYNSSGAWQYGNDGYYTMPLANETYYDLTFKYSSQANNTNNDLKVSVLNGEDGLAATSMGANKSTTLVKKSVRFKTGAAGNYLLSLENNGNTHLTDVTLLKTTLQTVKDELAAVKSEATALLDNAEYANVEGSEKTELNTAATATPEETIDAYLALIDEIKAKMTAFTAAKASYDAFAAAKATADPELSYASAEKKTAFTAATAATAENAEEAAAKTAAITTALRAYYESHALAEGVDGAVDLSSILANANADKNTGWTNGIGTNEGQGYTDADGIMATKYLDGGWAQNAGANIDMTRELEILPKGKYLLSVTARGATNLDEYALSVGETSINLPKNGSNGGIFGNGWDDVSVEFESDGTTALTLEIKANSTAAQQWISLNRFRLVRLELYAAKATAADYAALNEAIATAEAKELGFEAGQYAPYNNVAAMEALAAAKAINQEVENMRDNVNALTTALTAATWTANTEEVNAIYDGTLANAPIQATSENVVLTGWVTKDGKTRQTFKGTDENGKACLADADAQVGLFVHPGTYNYGETTGYTMPLKAGVLYMAEAKYCSWAENSNVNFTLTILKNGASVASKSYGANKAASTVAGALKRVKLYFTPEDDADYVLSVNTSGNTFMTDFYIKKAVAENITIAEDADYTPAETYADVTFNRMVVAGWNGMVLPFDATVAAVKSAFGATAVKDFAGIAYDEAKGVTLKFQDATEVKAGRPFMMKAAAGASYTFKGVVLPATGLQNIEMVDETNSNVKYTMKGTYAATTDLSDVNFALINGNNFFYHTAGVNSSSAKAFRAYFENNSTEPASARVSFDFGDDETTGIEEIRQNAAANGQYYDLQGRKVQNLNKKGVYLLNGKKVTVK